MKVLVAHNIGAIAITDANGIVNGIISERDYLNKVQLSLSGDTFQSSYDVFPLPFKVAFLGRDPTKTRVDEVGTMGYQNLVTVTKFNPIDRCMEKMLAREVRHLLVRRKEDGVIVGMLSIKDIVKCAHLKHKAKLARLEDIITSQEIAKSPY